MASKFKFAKATTTSKESKVYKTGEVSVLGVSVMDPDKPCLAQKKDEKGTVVIKKVPFSNDTRYVIIAT